MGKNTGKLQHQSCWEHLTRTSKEAATDPKASREVQVLHNSLKKKMYKELSADLKVPFNAKRREILYDLYSIKIRDIIQAKYKHKDTQSIQIRIANQNTAF